MFSMVTVFVQWLKLNSVIFLRFSIDNRAVDHMCVVL